MGNVLQFRLRTKKPAAPTPVETTDSRTIALFNRTFTVEEAYRRFILPTLRRSA